MHKGHYSLQLYAFWAKPIWNEIVWEWKWNIYKHVRIKQLNIFSIIVEFRDYFLLEQTEFSFVQFDGMFKW